MKGRRDSGVKDSGLEGYMKGGIHDWRDSGLDGFRTTVEGYMKGVIQERRVQCKSDLYCKRRDAGQDDSG